MHTIGSNRVIDEANLGFVDTDENLIFANANSFSQYVEQRAIKEGIDCVDILLEICETKDVDPDEIAELISKPLKNKVEAEMIRRGQLKSSSILDFEE